MNQKTEILLENRNYLVHFDILYILRKERKISIEKKNQTKKNNKKTKKQNNKYLNFRGVEDTSIEVFLKFFNEDTIRKKIFMIRIRY